MTGRHRATSLALLMGICATSALGQRALSARIAQSLTHAETDMIAFRRLLHRHPEVSGSEVWTARTIVDRLRAAGVETRTGVGGHGVLGIVRGRHPGPVVAYRADMDAVATELPDPVLFRSEIAGVRHICGHDLHSTIGLALAEAFVRHRSELAGTVVFFFQPAEESATGAQAMVAAGALRTLTPVAIYGLHTAPLPVGQLATAPGDLMSGHDAYTITIRGGGDIQSMARVVHDSLVALSTIDVSAQYQPQPRELVLAYAPERKDSSGSVLLRGTIITTSLTRESTARRVAAFETLSTPGTRVTVTYQRKRIAGVFNDSLLTVRGVAAISRIPDAPGVVPLTTVVPAFSEDFGVFQDAIPGVFFFLGVSNPAKGTVGMPHTPDYIADEAAILVGAKAMAAVLLDRLSLSVPIVDVRKKRSGS
jgi:metal-dependent amidase/aminoacylase/carboxypeptidase family protein